MTVETSREPVTWEATLLMAASLLLSPVGSEGAEAAAAAMLLDLESLRPPRRNHRLKTPTLASPDTQWRQSLDAVGYPALPSIGVTSLKNKEV